MKMKCVLYEDIGMNWDIFVEVDFQRKKKQKIFFNYSVLFYEDLNRFRPVYSAKDFLDVICVLVNPNLKIDEALWK